MALFTSLAQPACPHCGAHSRGTTLTSNNIEDEHGPASKRYHKCKACYKIWTTFTRANGTVEVRLTRTRKLQSGL